MSDTNSRSTPGTSGTEQSETTTAAEGRKPTPRNRGDGEWTGLNLWAARLVHFLMVFIPAVLIGGYILEAIGAFPNATYYAPAVVGVAVVIAGGVGVLMVLYNFFRRTRQTELTEFFSSKD